MFRCRTAEIHHVDGEGRITQRWAFFDDTVTIVDFFAWVDPVPSNPSPPTRIPLT